VVAFDVKWRHGLPTLHRALNAVLAEDVAVMEMGHAPESFHPRFGALSRMYRYTILSQHWRSPVHRRTAWHLSSELDIGLAEQASRHLVGTHDFATFGQAPQGENTVRTVFEAQWQEHWPVLTFDIRANAFLYRMVRSVVGTLVLVGWGQVSPDEFESMLRARDRSRIKQVAPARGLCLMHVEYSAREGVLQ
jgi:tRNA pseudouridine38-40 synthase